MLPIKAPAKRASTVWQTFDVLLAKHNVCQFGHHTQKQKMFLNHFKSIGKRVAVGSVRPNIKLIDTSGSRLIASSQLLNTIS